MSDNLKECKCKNCLHEGKMINLDTDKYVVKNDSYFHEDCYKSEDDILNIMSIWAKQIDKNVSFSYLRKELNRLIYKQKNPSGYVLFCVKRGANGGHLHYIPGIKYFVDNDKMRQDYNAYLKQTEIRNHKFVVDEEDTREPKFNGGSKPIGFGSIFGGKN